MKNYPAGKKLNCSENAECGFPHFVLNITSNSNNTDNKNDDDDEINAIKHMYINFEVMQF